MDKMSQISVAIPDSIRAEIQELSRQTGLKAASMIRLWIYKGLKSEREVTTN